MYFSSKSDSVVPRQKVTFECGRYNISRGEDNIGSVVREMEKVAKLHSVSMDDIQISYDYGQDYDGDSRNLMILSFKRDETDEEYKKRIAAHERKDVQEGLQVLAGFRSLACDKAAFKEVFKRVKAACPGVVPYWQEKQLAEFFGTETVDEIKQRAFNEGVARGREEVENMQVQIRKALAGLAP